ncbi:MAG: flagellar protein FliT [Candidatus Nitrotoga sp.]
MNSLQIITCYESLSVLTERMCEAAAHGEWDKLINIEQQRGRQVATMRLAEASAMLDEPTRQRKKQLIEKILADDTRIHRHTEKWLKQLQCIMQSNRQEQRLQQTYGS